ncbi:14830_t:CDS:2 [Gigaspora margarita]|uniref:14830_t:CDS:1 n=1 Tax=Gigaspora margarita TaxID=4874 RepID=A0ABN7V2S4_GIGMA|nr:14830_t:CDS:2 [Gigaspora margarita]
MVEPLNHVHSIIEPSALNVSNASESNTAVIDSSSGVQSSAQSSKNKQPDVVAQNKNLTNAEVSKVILKHEEVRFQWEKLIKHMQDHPDYVYQPNRNCNSSTSSSTTTTYSTIIPSDKNVLMTDEAMITAIVESAFAESKSSPPSFRYPVIPNSPFSSFLSPSLSERSSNQSSLQLLALRFLLKALLIHP